MNISHVEVEIRIRPIDRRNAPIAEVVHIATGTEEQATQWVHYAKLPQGFKDALSEALLRARERKDPYV
jgi:hypothetical protein